MEKIKDFFVASKIYETTVFKSNNKTGFVDHQIKVSKKKYLIYSTIDDNGVVRYREYETGNIVSNNTQHKSFTNKAAQNDIKYYSFMDSFAVHKKNKMRTRFKENNTNYGFFMPLNDYIKMTIPFYNAKITNKYKAQAIVKLLNGINFGKIKLDYNYDEAHKQLEEIKCYKKRKEDENKEKTYVKAA